MSTAEVDYEGIAAPQTGQVEQNDFSGGWNCRDAPSEVADNESPNCENMTLDERGGAVERLGLATLSDALAGAAQSVFVWETGGLVMFQIGDTLYKSSTFGGVSAVKTFSDDGLVGMCDFLSKLVLVHPSDGVFVYTGSGSPSQTNGAPHNMSDVRGNCIASWQNACWVIGDPRTDYGVRVWRSALGDPTTWDTSATGNWVDLRELDDLPLTAFSTEGGQDIVGRPGLIVCKEHSVYRINDSSDMSYTTLHTQAGASGPRAVSTLLGVSCMVNGDGIWTTDGTTAPELRSSNIAPLFQTGQLDEDQMYLAAAGNKGDRVVFSMPRIIQGQLPVGNSFTLEFHPDQGWIVPHSFGCSAFAENRTTKDLYGMSPTLGKAFDVFSGGTDDGEPITAFYQTKWFVPTRMRKNRWRKVRISGRGLFDMYVRRDYTTGQGEIREVDLSGDIALYNDGHRYNDGTRWGPDAYEHILDVWSLGVAEAISLEFRHSGSTSTTSPKLLGDGSGREMGAFAVYGLVMDFIKLGGA